MHAAASVSFLLPLCTAAAVHPRRTAVSLLPACLLTRYQKSGGRLTVVDKDVGAPSRPLVGLDSRLLDAVNAGKVDGDEVGLVDGQLPLFDDGKELVELGAVPRENRHGSAGLELWLTEAKGQDGRYMRKAREKLVELEGEKRGRMRIHAYRERRTSISRFFVFRA